MCKIKINNMNEKFNKRGGNTLMKSKREIMDIINKLDDHIADDFEAQDLDFKQ